MTPRELAHIAVKRAEVDLLYDLQKLEFIFEHPALNADQNLVNCFTEFALDRLRDICSQYRKGHIGETDRKILVGNDRFYVIKDGPRHILMMNTLKPVMLRWIPEDMDEILAEFADQLSCRWDMVEDIVSDYWVRRKAGDMAKTTVDVMLKHLLEEKTFGLMIICRRDGSWGCTLHSEEKQKSISFISGPRTIYDDVRRLINED